MKPCLQYALMLSPILACGCFDPAALSQKRENVADPTGAAVVAQDPLAPDPAAAPQQANPAPAAAPAQPAAPVAVDFAKLDYRLVDKKAAMAENPNLVIKNTAKLGGEAGDYLTAVSQAYVSARTRIYVMQLQHELDLQRALNDFKYPSFEQFQTALKQAQVQLENVYPWEVYAYDAEAGEIQLLEDPDLRRKMRAEKGLPVD